MTEKTFRDLGFSKIYKKCEISEEIYHYYRLDIGDIIICSNRSDMAEVTGPEAYIMDSKDIVIKGAGDLEDIVAILQRNLIF